MDRQYLVGFVAGGLLGVAIGVPGAYALSRDVQVPDAPSLEDHRLAWLISESVHDLSSAQPERALPMILAVQRIDPSNADNENNLCVAMIGLHRYVEAIDACEAALRLKDDFQLARNNLAWAKSEQAKSPVAQR